MSNPRTPNYDPLLLALRATRDVSVFQPLPEHIRAKSNFWTYFGTGEGSPLPRDPNLATALQFSGDKRISQWWDIPGFQDWFLNRDEFRQRMEYLSNLALDQLEGILTSGVVASSDKLSAIKLIMQVAEKVPTNKAAETEGVDAMIAKMSKVQLEEYIRGSMRLLPPTTLDLPAPTE